MRDRLIAAGVEAGLLTNRAGRRLPVRVEGDNDNAGYWYRRAGKAPATGSLKREWEEIATALCEA